jgi:hypothetical protein
MTLHAGPTQEEEEAVEVIDMHLAIDQLPAEDALAILLRFGFLTCGEVTCRDAGDVIGCGINGVLNRVHRGIRTMRWLLQRGISYAHPQAPTRRRFGHRDPLHVLEAAQERARVAADSGGLPDACFWSERLRVRVRMPKRVAVCFCGRWWRASPGEKEMQVPVHVRPKSGGEIKPWRPMTSATTPTSCPSRG